jgi:uncharacterized protein (DUF1684 family)
MKLRNNSFLNHYLVWFSCLSIILMSCLASKNKLSYNDALLQYRKTYKQSFLDDERAPLKEEDLVHLNFFEPDPSWRMECTCQRVHDAVPFEMPLYSNITRTYIVYSILHCNHRGQKISLHTYKSIAQPSNPLYSQYLFLPFKDNTNGEETYGGGRYIDLKISDIVNDKVIIDFNHSYNPWCAYSDGYNCPIPPVENHLSIPVRAGEKMYTGTYKERSK